MRNDFFDRPQVGFLLHRRHPYGGNDSGRAGTKLVRLPAVERRTTRTGAFLSRLPVWGSAGRFMVGPRRLTGRRGSFFREYAVDYPSFT